MNDEVFSRIKYIEDFNRVIDKYHINTKDICLISSCALAIRGIKENADIEFAMNSSARKVLLEHYGNELQMNPYTGNVKFGSKIGLEYNTYSVFDIDDDILFGDDYSEQFGNYRIIIPEIQAAMKILQNRDKDVMHLSLMQNSGIWTDGFVKKINFLLDKAKKNGFEIPHANCNAVWNQIFEQPRKIYIFGTGHIGEHVFYRIKRDELINSLSGFIVSKRQQVSQLFFEKPVKEIQEIVNENPIVIVAVTISKMVETMRLLANAGIKDLIQGYQFWINEA